MADDCQVLAFQQVVPWRAWIDRPVREAIEAGMVQSLRELVIVKDYVVDEATFVPPREVGRSWRHDTGEVEDGFPVYAYLPTPPEEDPDPPPSLVSVRAEVTGRPRPKAPGSSTLTM